MRVENYKVWRSLHFSHITFISLIYMFIYFWNLKKKRFYSLSPTNATINLLLSRHFSRKKSRWYWNSGLTTFKSQYLQDKLNNNTLLTHILWQKNIASRLSSIYRKYFEIVICTREFCSNQKVGWTVLHETFPQNKLFLTDSWKKNKLGGLFR